MALVLGVGTYIAKSEDWQAELTSLRSLVLSAGPDETVKRGKRGYNLYFSSAKQVVTRVSRLEKSTDKILTEKGMTDR